MTALAPLIIVAAIPIILVSPDAVLDLAFIVNDLRNRDYASFYLNAVGLMIPGVTGLGMLSKADEAYDGYRLLNTVDNISDSRNTINYTDNWIDDAACFNSFSADTTIVTDKGDISISQIQIGGFVLAWNEETNEITFELVTDTIHHTDEVVVYLTIDGEEIETTPEHPFYVEGAGWTDAEDLQLGDEIRNADGETGEIESITIEEVTQEMYNLTVDEAHTFFVGDGQWLVHNTSCDVKFGYKENIKFYKKSIPGVDYLDNFKGIIPDKPKNSLPLGLKY